MVSITLYLPDGKIIKTQVSPKGWSTKDGVLYFSGDGGSEMTPGKYRTSLPFLVHD
jgi:hypothetical protein